MSPLTQHKSTTSNRSIKSASSAKSADQSFPEQLEEAPWPVLPTETEIYILPDGQIVIADLPAELAPLVTDLGKIEPCAIEPYTVEKGNHEEIVAKK